ncbi:MAG: hypothetical protein Q7K43_01670 [Candidatus Woesearchaeota archaeon]|nr:hypothetical protein [Candidatus Woesearchaeota archaeon]
MFEIRVNSLDNGELFSELIDGTTIVGLLRYDVLVECQEQKIEPGTNVKAKITLLNLGDYYEDVDLVWGVEDSSLKSIGKSSLPLAIYGGQKKELEQSFYVPINAKQGTYSFFAEVNFADQTKRGSCGFVVEAGVDFLYKRINELEKKMNELQETIKNLRNEGFDVDALEERLLAIRKIILETREQINPEQFDTISEKITSIEEKSREIETLVQEIKKSTEFKDMQEKFTIIGIAGAIVLLLLAVMYKFGFDKKIKDTFFKDLGTKTTNAKKQTTKRRKKGKT